MSKPVFQAVLCNQDDRRFGAATIPFPLSKDEYDHSLEVLTDAEMGDPVQQDCHVTEVISGWPALKVLEGQNVNVDELDYLAKRLENLGDEGQDAQFQAMANLMRLTDIKDLINLTFCCQQATVIEDFRDLKAIGQAHIFNINGGSVLYDVLENTDLEATALDLILSGNGIVTPYGVAYDNGMKLEELYKGQTFPGYLYERSEVVLSITPKDAPAGADPTFIYLPALQSQIDRALQRGGIDDLSTAHIEVDCDFLPLEAGEALHLETESIEALNEMCRVVARLSDNDKRKLNAVVVLAGPRSAQQLQSLAEDIELFGYAPDVQTPEELGEYMVKESGHYEYDPNLEGFYDYEKLGRQRMEEHAGQFTVHGYISYEGAQPLQELMEPNKQDLQMGGMA